METSFRAVKLPRSICEGNNIKLDPGPAYSNFVGQPLLPLSAIYLLEEVKMAEEARTWLALSGFVPALGPTCQSTRRTVAPQFL